MNCGKSVRALYFLWGENDRTVPMEIGKKLHNDLANSIISLFSEYRSSFAGRKAENVYREIVRFIR
jgi:hypothetical protein